MNFQVLYMLLSPSVEVGIAAFTIKNGVTATDVVTGIDISQTKPLSRYFNTELEVHADECMLNRHAESKTHVYVCRGNGKHHSLVVFGVHENDHVTKRIFVLGINSDGQPEFVLTEHHSWNRTAFQKHFPQIDEELDELARENLGCEVYMLSGL